MKRFIIGIFCFLMLLSFPGCGAKKTELKEPVNFYYCNEEIFYNSSAGVIQAEVREAANFHGSISDLLYAYLAGPVSHTLVSPIPENTSLISFEILENEAYLTLSQEFFSLNGIRLSTACSCITMTVSEYIPVAAVHFCVENNQIENKDEIVMNVADIVLMDEESQKGQ